VTLKTAVMADGNSALLSQEYTVFTFHFLDNHVAMAIFQDDNVKIHQDQTVKEWLGGSRPKIY